MQIVLSIALNSKELIAEYLDKDITVKITFTTCMNTFFSSPNFLVWTETEIQPLKRAMGVVFCAMV